MNLPHFNKKKALIYGGGLVVVLLLIMLFRNASGGGNSGTVTNVQAGTDPNVLASQTSLALAQIGAASSANQTAAQMTIAQQQIQADLAKSAMTADLTRYGIDAQTHQIDVQTAAAAASDARNADLQASVAKWTLDNAAQMQANNNAFQLMYAANANASMESIAEMNFQLSQTQIKSNENVTIASLESQASQLNSYLGAQTAMSESSDAKDVALAKIQSSTTKHGQSTNLIGSIIGGALSIFSDESLKRDAVRLGTTREGIDVYGYRYNDSDNFTIGVMAQDVRAKAPHALGPIVEGKYTVNYERLKLAA